MPPSTGHGQQAHLENGSHSPVASTSQARVKHSRPHSPVLASIDPSQAHDLKPPAPKRARKAINCEPCRNSKLKCDRNRPCSSCVLRGTTASCYQNESDGSGRADEQSHSRIDPAAEFARIRQSIALLESHIVQNGSITRPTPVGHTASAVATSPLTQKPTMQLPAPPTSIQGGMPKKEITRGSYSPISAEAKADSAPGLLGQSDHSGFFAGPTSALSHLLSVREEVHDGPLSSTALDNLGSTLRSSNTFPESTTPPGAYQGYDEDLIALLPPLHAVDGLIDFYFEYCNWIYRHVNEPAFLKSWSRYKSGHGGDRVILATVCILILLAVRYLPKGHPLLASLPGSTEELATKYYGVMREALERHQRDLRKDGMGKGYSLDLIELLLVRSHYLTFAKEDPEETWAIKGELINIGTAMGLHKDPGETRFSRFESERRRWAWWHIILFERWQAFMFGRPLSIASHHYNTRLPADCDPALDKSGRLYQPNIALMKLAGVLGYIMHDAVSFQPVPYSSIEAHDQRLADWYDELPEELDLDEFRIARSLASPVTSVRRFGVQSVIIRAAYYHIRFTLHRPYVSIPSSQATAVSAASKLISLVGQASPEFLSNTALAVPGHMNWGPFHVFSAAMFFSFQLITHPDQPPASLFRENIKKAITCLEQSRWMPVADKALTILQALAPLYSDDFASELPQERRRKKSHVLNLVRKLAFPYQDAGSLKGDSSSGSSPALGVSSQNVFQEDPSPSTYGSMQKQTQTQIPTSSLRWTPTDADGPSTHSHRPSSDAISAMHGVSPINSTPNHHLPQGMHSQYPNQLSQHNSHTPTYHMGYEVDMHHQVPTNVPQQSSEFYVQPTTDEGYMWGASVGFGLSEWAQFLDVMQRPDDRMRGMPPGGGK